MNIDASRAEVKGNHDGLFREALACAATLEREFAAGVCVRSTIRLDFGGDSPFASLPIGAGEHERFPDPPGAMVAAGFLGLAIDDRRWRIVRGERVAEFAGKPGAWELVRALVAAGPDGIESRELARRLPSEPEIDQIRKLVSALRPRLKAIRIVVPYACAGRYRIEVLPT